MPERKSYDYAIVGAGSAGCVLAYRLTADPAIRVLLLEAGGRDTHPLIHVPIGLGKMWERRMFDWGYDTEPEPGLDHRRIEAMRGKVLGGSSSINVMAYVRGHPGDYDRWARQGCPGWSYAEVLPYFKRCESWEQGENAWRGGHGPLGVIGSRNRDPLFDGWLEAAQEADWPFTEDYNGQEPEGFGRSQWTIRNGRRCSAAVAFLRPAMRRSNLTVETNALATRVLLEGTRAVGLEYVQNGRLHRAAVTREVLLAGGVFNTPQLLMLSGIGEADHLREFGIEPRVHLPGVGRNLQDHLSVDVHHARRSPGPFHAQMRLDRAALNMVRAYAFGTGPATVLPSGLHAFLKTRRDVPVPDIQFLFRGAPARAHPWFPGVRPALRGQLRSPAGHAPSGEPGRRAAALGRAHRSGPDRAELSGHRGRRPRHPGRREAGARHRAAPGPRPLPGPRDGPGPRLPHRRGDRRLRAPHRDHGAPPVRHVRHGHR